MIELIARLLSRPGVAVLLLLSSFVISILMLVPPIYVMQVLNRYVAFGVDGTLFTLASGALLAVAMEFLLRWARLRIANNVSVKADDELARKLGEFLTDTRLGQADQVKTSTKRRLMMDLEVVQSAYSAPSINTVLDVPFTAILIVAVLVIDPMLAAITVAACLFLTVCALASAAAEKHAARERTSSDRPAIGPIQDDIVSTPEVVRAFTGRTFVLHAWRTAVRAQQSVARKLAHNRGMISTISNATTALTTIAVVGVGAILVVRREIDVGILIAANILSARTVAGFSRFAFAAGTFARASQTLARLRQLEKMPREAKSGAMLGDFAGRLTFDDVTFAYGGTTAPLFEGVSFSLEPGDILIVHGGNGTGKSSFAELVMGLREPLRGAILVDGVDLRQVAMPWWRTQTCYLPQNTALLNTSISDNLRVLKPDLDGDALNRAIQAADARDLIARMPAGLETPIEDNGRHFAPGERKRLALARALTSQGKLVLFDEPLEGLDGSGKAAIGSLLKSFASSGRTIIVCSSDPAIIREADWLLDLDEKPRPKLVKGPGRKGRDTRSNLAVADNDAPAASQGGQA
ncbi:ATP-binding cassette domain-containing protein [Hwanghaeella sp.]|uniref:ATP-binding cassette domain-containing protein n=1 Tax=Hwanghaeella sp. TaxID=2605943 RepID=UPI003CCBC286